MNLKALFIKYIKHRENLNKGKIYKLVDNTNENIYIGSTCNSLNKRLSQHNSHYKRYLKRQYGNMKSFDIIKNNDFTIKLLEKCNIKTKQELYQRERYYIENNECLNKNIPGRTLKEYKETKKLIRIEEKSHYNIIKGKMNDFQKLYIILIGNFYNIIRKNYIKTDNKKDIVPLKEIYNIFKESDIYFFSTKEQKRTINYKNFIEKLKYNLLFKNYL